MPIKNKNNIFIKFYVHFNGLAVGNKHTKCSKLKKCSKPKNVLTSFKLKNVTDIKILQA